MIVWKTFFSSHESDLIDLGFDTWYQRTLFYWLQVLTTIIMRLGLAFLDLSKLGLWRCYFLNFLSWSFSFVFFFPVFHNSFYEKLKFQIFKEMGLFILILFSIHQAHLIWVFTYLNPGIFFIYLHSNYYKCLLNYFLSL